MSNLYEGVRNGVRGLDLVCQVYQRCMDGCVHLLINLELAPLTRIAMTYQAWLANQWQPCLTIQSLVVLPQDCLICLR